MSTDADRPPPAAAGTEAAGESARIVDDATVFAELYPGLRRFAGAVRPAHVEADDLVQEAVARTLRKRRLADLDDPGAYLRAAIVRLASNERRSWWRGRRAVERTDPTIVTHDVRPSDLDDLRALAPSDRAVLYLAVVDGLSYSEVSEIMGCTEEAARTRASRARRRLRSELEKDSELEEEEST